MELNDVTSEMIKTGTQIVVVELEEHNYLTFLVTDCENPQVPGYPARSLTYFETLESARLAIKSLYEKIGSPKHHLAFDSVFRSRRR